MTSDTIRYSESRDVPLESVLTFYRADKWSSAQKPDLLHKALLASHSLNTAWDGVKMVGLGNAISDGHLVAYYPHLLVLPEYQGRVFFFFFCGYAGGAGPRHNTAWIYKGTLKEKP